MLLTKTSTLTHLSFRLGECQGPSRPYSAYVARVPVEILYRIASYCDAPSCVSAMTACSAWYFIFRRELYREISFANDNRLSLFVTALSDRKESATLGTNPAGLVRQITFREEILSKDDLLLFTRLCTGLESAVVTDPFFSRRFLLYSTDKTAWPSATLRKLHIAVRELPQQPLLHANTFGKHVTELSVVCTQLSLVASLTTLTPNIQKLIIRHRRGHICKHSRQEACELTDLEQIHANCKHLTVLALHGICLHEKNGHIASPMPCSNVASLTLENVGITSLQTLFYFQSKYPLLNHLVWRNITPVRGTSSWCRRELARFMQGIPTCWRWLRTVTYCQDKPCNDSVLSDTSLIPAFHRCSNLKTFVHEKLEYH